MSPALARAVAEHKAEHDAQVRLRAQSTTLATGDYMKSHGRSKSLSASDMRDIMRSRIDSEQPLSEASEEFLEQMKSGRALNWLLDCVNYAFSSPIGTVLTVQAWLLGSMCVYKGLNSEMNWADCYYYSVQAGLSIGFGSLSETHQGSRVFSGFHVILGGLVVGDDVEIVHRHFQCIPNRPHGSPMSVQDASSRNGSAIWWREGKV